MVLERLVRVLVAVQRKGEIMSKFSIFKTAKGTELPVMDLKGKDYLEVKWRIVWFREEHPNWSIETEAVHRGVSDAIFRATIRDDQGRILAVSHKSETKQGFEDFIEKAETGAIGRALALCGYGTQFCADDLDEGSRLADSPIERPAENRKATVVPITKSATSKQQGLVAPKPAPAPAPQPESQDPGAFGNFAEGPPKLRSRGEISNDIWDVAKSIGYTQASLETKARNFNGKSGRDMDATELTKFLGVLTEEAGRGK